MKQFLNAPYPVNTSYRRSLLEAFSIALFVSVFLVLFQPFGLSSLESEYKYLLIASFGLPCFPVIAGVRVLSVWIFRNYDWERNWKVKHSIILTLIVPFLIGAANYIHGTIIFDWSFSWAGLGRMEFYTVAVSFFPIVGVVALDWSSLVRRHESVAHFLNRSVYPEDTGETSVDSFSYTPEVVTITLTGENREETFTLSPERILFVKAEGNYVEVFLESVHGNGNLESTLLRTTLKALEQQLSGFVNAIVRCHRSYLVNREKITRASGNAQGLLLKLEAGNQDIPVSRRYVELFRKQ